MQVDNARPTPAGIAEWFGLRSLTRQGQALILLGESHWLWYAEWPFPGPGVMLIWGSRIFCPASKPGVDISTNQHGTGINAGIISTPPIAKDARDENAKIRRINKLNVSPGE